MLYYVMYVVLYNIKIFRITQNPIRNVHFYFKGNMTKIQVFTLVFLAMDVSRVGMKNKRQQHVSRDKLSMDTPPCVMESYFKLKCMFF